MFRPYTRRRLEEELTHRGLALVVVRNGILYRRMFRAENVYGHSELIGSFPIGGRPDWKAMIERLSGPGIIHTLGGKEST